MILSDLFNLEMSLSRKPLSSTIFSIEQLGYTGAVVAVVNWSVYIF